MPVIAFVRPAQNDGHVPARLFAPCQVERYGDRTASGTAGGRIGVSVPLVGGACACTPSASAKAAADIVAVRFFLWEVLQGFIRGLSLRCINAL